MKKYILYFLVLSVAFLSSCSATADEIKRVVCLGADLTEEQRNEMLSLFDTNKDEAYSLEITNKEERAYLEGLVSEQLIGTKAISCAYVETLQEGEGISIKTYNIDWVTDEMYANAMATAGLKNARVTCAAPFKVSGTAALTGIIKAFEKVSGKELPEESKQTANEELIATGELGDDVGRERAAALVNRIKERILRDKIKNSDGIRKIIIDISGDMKINLTEEQIDKLAELMEKISRLDLNVDKITEQLKGINKGLDQVGETLKENKGILQKILDAIKSFFKWLSGLLK